MTTRLALYNAALLLCGERSLSSLTEEREPRRMLDTVWDGGGVRYCLEAGQWNFAMRAVQIDYDPTITPAFGFSRAFDKQDDWVRTASVCSDEFFNVPLLHYLDEVNYLFCDLDVLYVRYVSDNENFGGDLARWPGTFTEFATAYFASKIVNRLTADKDLGVHVQRELKRTRIDARSKDAMGDPTAFPPAGSWLRARHANRGSRNDRGNRNSLIG
jgi:hypothetical protein